MKSVGIWIKKLMKTETRSFNPFSGNTFLGRRDGGIVRRMSEHYPEIEEKMLAEEIWSRIQSTVRLEGLPLFSEVAPDEVNQLFILKLHHCCLILDSDESQLGLRAKLLKTEALVQVSSVIQSSDGSLINDNLELIFKMLKINTNPDWKKSQDVVCGCDSDDEPDVEIYAAGQKDNITHSHVAKIIMLHLLSHNELNLKLAEKYIDDTFCTSLVYMFTERDKIIRELLQKILHTVYRRILKVRITLRTAMRNMFLDVLYDSFHCCGINELLVVISSIICGLNMPLKKEYVDLLDKFLIPLHRSSEYSFFGEHLTLVMEDFIAKDYTLLSMVVNRCVRYLSRHTAINRIELISNLDKLIVKHIIDEDSNILIPFLERLLLFSQNDHYGLATKSISILSDDLYFIHMLNFKSDFISRLVSMLNQVCLGHWNINVKLLAISTVNRFQCQIDGT